LSVEGIGLDVIQVPKREPRITVKTCIIGWPRVLQAHTF
jgi:hypothetical protein